MQWQGYSYAFKCRYYVIINNEFDLFINNQLRCRWTVSFILNVYFSRQIVYLSSLKITHLIWECTQYAKNMMLEIQCQNSNAYTILYHIIHVPHYNSDTNIVFSSVWESWFACYVPTVGVLYAFSNTQILTAWLVKEETSQWKRTYPQLIWRLTRERQFCLVVSGLHC